MALAACGTGAGGQAGVGGSGSRGLTVVTAMYPVEYLVSRVAGEHADVVNLAETGADPHDLELTPRDVAALQQSDLVVFAAGMQPAVDDAVATQAADHSLDLSPAADLLTLEAEGHDGQGTHDDAEDGGSDAHGHGGLDLHFWLDPVRYGAAGSAVAEELATRDPAHAASYRANAATLLTELTALDADYEEGLADCTSRDLVTTHAAFGYLAHRYDLHQIAITGLTPESEPSPARMAAVMAEVRDLGVSTVFSEVLLGPALADTVARETGAQVLVLDPVEGITDQSAGADYLAVMRANLATLRTGLGCG